MRRLAALGLALLACSGPARTAEPVRPTTPVAPLPPEAPAEPPRDPAPIPTVHARRDVSEAPHGGSIMTLAMSPDGKTVLSADELGGVRLWPALDASAEPRIVEMPMPKQLAIGQIPGGYSAVALDEAGGLYLAKLDDAGRQLSHTSIGADPPVAGIAMTDVGLLAWRSDQILERLDADGAQLDKLATEPEQRLVTLAVAGKRAVAVMEKEGGKRTARWLALEPKLAWGGWIKLDSELTGTIDLALAPNGKRLGVLARNERTVVGAVFDITKAGGGKVLATAPFNSSSADIAFADDDDVAMGGFEGVIWLELQGDKPKPRPLVPMSPGSRPQAVLVAGGGHAVSAFNGELTIWSPGSGTTPSYLGYDTISPRLTEVGPNGSLVVAVADHVLLLDKDLRATAGPLTQITGMVSDLRWVGDENWLLENTSTGDGTLQVMLLDSKGFGTPLRKGLKENQILSYEPSTQLVTLSFGQTAEVARLNKQKNQLEHVASAAKASPYEQVMLVPMSPALAHGAQVVQVTMKDKSTIKWLPNAAQLDKPSATVTVDGPFAGADAAGHIYMWRNTPGGQLELVVYADGKPLKTLPNTGAIALWPEPAGTRYVEVAPSSVALYDLAGKQRWFQQLSTSQEALWLTDGSIAITSAGGIARLDAATGNVLAARCGWRFGLASKPHPAAPRVEPLCAQVRR